ncbi:hypothetical protein ACFQZI_10040 [Mucilaginibacter lutimaris]|uniref:DUF5017 domain-containing protein n=1 Tax=Mucilaginibacter lutimaris TaxID=931629 RepID=A0ABW2ZGB0_9SPHI
MKMLKLLVFVLLLTWLFSACKKDSVNYDGFTPNLPTAGNGGTESGSGNGNVGSAEYYFKAKINNIQVTWAVDDQRSHWAEGISNATSIDNDIITGSYGGSISSAEVFMVNEPRITFFFKTFHFVGFDDRVLAFENFVKTGPQVFAANGNLDIGKKEVFVQYIDKNKVEYSTAGFQTNSFFNVESVTIVPAQPGLPEKLKIKLKIQCTLYPTSGTGNTMQLTDGEAVIYIKLD